MAREAGLGSLSRLAVMGPRRLRWPISRLQPVTVFQESGGGRLLSALSALAADHSSLFAAISRSCFRPPPDREDGCIALLHDQDSTSFHLGYCVFSFQWRQRSH